MELGSNPARFGLILVLVFFVALEAAYLILKRGRKEYPWGHTMASFGVFGVKRLIDVLTAGAAAAVFFWIYEHRIATLEITGPFMLLACFLAVEFFYYWHHRFAHEVRWFWANHAVHHSAPYMNLSVSGRLGATSVISGSVFFFAPLAYLGFHPVTIFLMLGAGLFYQIWIHNDFIPRLGFLDWIFNTPSNHRVHHASNPEYLDKNYGAVLMVFDVVFGTYQRERDDVDLRYGMVRPMNSKNPFAIAFFEWGRMAQDLRAVKRPKDVLGYLFGRPGWKPKATRLTMPGAEPASVQHAA